MKNILPTALIALVITGGFYFFAPKNGRVQTPTKKESAYERVMRTGVLKCGYALWPPHMLTKEANTGEIKGLMPDLMQILSKKLDLKLEWTEETGWGSFIESLKSNRVDVFCAGVWRNAERGRYISYVEPLF